MLGKYPNCVCVAARLSIKNMFKPFCGLCGGYVCMWVCVCGYKFIYKSRGQGSDNKPQALVFFSHYIAQQGLLFEKLYGRATKRIMHYFMCVCDMWPAPPPPLGCHRCILLYLANSFIFIFKQIHINYVLTKRTRNYLSCIHIKYRNNKYCRI